MLRGKRETGIDLVDHGSAFYAPAVTVDASGRTLLQVLSEIWPKRLAEAFAKRYGHTKPLVHYKQAEFDELMKSLREWPFHPSGTEGYPKAEVTLGGVDQKVELGAAHLEVVAQRCMAGAQDLSDALGFVRCVAAQDRFDVFLALHFGHDVSNTFEQRGQDVFGNRRALVGGELDIAGGHGRFAVRAGAEHRLLQLREGGAQSHTTNIQAARQLEAVDLRRGVGQAPAALHHRMEVVAVFVIERDQQVNAYDVEIDEKCVELLALYQPAAGDLRFITTAMKIVTDLERIGDQAVNIAQRAIELNREPQLKPYIDLPRMAERAQRMVKDSLDAFVARDTEQARRVCAEDAAVDALKEQIFRELLTFMMEDPKTIPRAIRLILISRFLERVADHATNIAEMVIYLVDSKMVRHTLA